VPAKNKFFESVGFLPPVTQKLADQLRSMGEEKSLTFIRDSARKQSWLAI
jgi:hypothetical protein